MENDKQVRIEFKKILNLWTAEDNSVPSWEQIFNEVGKLQERATQRDKEPMNVPMYPPLVPQPTSSPVHYHNGSPCYSNPCVWCGTN